MFKLNDSEKNEIQKIIDKYVQDVLDISHELDDFQDVEDKESNEEYLEIKNRYYKLELKIESERKRVYNKAWERYSRDKNDEELLKGAKDTLLSFLQKDIDIIDNPNFGFYKQLEKQMQTRVTPIPQNNHWKPINREELLRYIISDYYSILEENAETKAEIDKYIRGLNDMPSIEIMTRISNIASTNDSISMTMFGMNGFIIHYGVKNEIAVIPEHNIKTEVTINYDLEGIEIQKELTPFEKNILDVITTLYINGNSIVSLQQIYKLMSESEQLSPQMKEEIRGAIRILMKTSVIIDYSNELRFRTKDKKAYAEIESTLLNGRLIQAQYNGNEVDAFEIFSTPILYEYANHANNQIARQPRLKIQNSRNTKKTLTIKSYLMNRITTMKNSKKVSNAILYDTLYSVIERSQEVKNKQSRKEQKAIRDSAIKILDTLKKEGHIKGYEETSKGKKKHSIVVDI